MVKNIIQYQLLVRNIKAADYFEKFLISAVSSVLLIRFFLYITSYPTLGLEGIHIAHMLWGGILMLFSIMLLITYLNQFMMNIAAILGGIGFGTFIDELGKFLTSDNNYFFQPTIALIYILFISLFLIFKKTVATAGFNDKEYIVNSLTMIGEAMMNDLDQDEKKRAYEYLDKYQIQRPIVKHLIQVLHDVEALPVKAPGKLTIFKDQLQKLYFNLVKSSWFAKAITVLFVIFPIFTAFFIYKLIFNFIEHLYTGGFLILSLFEYGYLISMTISALFALLGISIIYKSRYRAYKNFRRSVLTSIFFTQFFAFYSVMFFALILLVVNITILVALDYMIDQEKLNLKGL